MCQHRSTWPRRLCVGLGVVDRTESVWTVYLIWGTPAQESRRDIPKTPGVGDTEGALSPAVSATTHTGADDADASAAARSSVWSAVRACRGHFRQPNAISRPSARVSGGTSAANSSPNGHIMVHARGASVCLAGRRARSRDRGLRRVELYLT